MITCDGIQRKKTSFFFFSAAVDRLLAVLTFSSRLGWLARFLLARLLFFHFDFVAIIFTQLFRCRVLTVVCAGLVFQLSIFSPHYDRSEYSDGERHRKIDSTDLPDFQNSWKFSNREIILSLDFFFSLMYFFCLFQWILVVASTASIAKHSFGSAIVNPESEVVQPISATDLWRRLRNYTVWKLRATGFQWNHGLLIDFSFFFFFCLFFSFCMVHLCALYFSFMACVAVGCFSK